VGRGGFAWGGAWCGVAPRQDLQVSARTIWQLWRQRKISSAVALEDLLLSRDVGSQRFSDLVRRAEQAAGAEMWRRCATSVHKQLLGTLQPALPHAVVTSWIREFTLPKWRYKLLLLSGPSRIGKSIRAKTLFDPERYFLVTCQGLGSDLPSLREFDRDFHQVIIWAEITPQQVLANKVVFQGGVDRVSMAQSRCNGFAYSVWLWQAPQVLCSNYFPLEEVAADRESGRECISAEGADWLRANIVEAAPPDGMKWCDECAGEPAAKRVCAALCSASSAEASPGYVVASPVASCD